MVEARYGAGYKASLELKKSHPGERDDKVGVVETGVTGASSRVECMNLRNEESLREQQCERGSQGAKWEDIDYVFKCPFDPRLHGGAPLPRQLLSLPFKSSAYIKHHRDSRWLGVFPSWKATPTTIFYASGLCMRLAIAAFMLAGPIRPF